MGMFIMNGKTFLKTYIQEDPDVVLDSQFVLVSSTIRKAGRYEKQVINAAKVLYPPTLLIVDYQDYKDPSYVAQYRDHLDEVARPFIATIIQYALDADSSNVILMCAKREWKYRFLQILRDYIWDEFGYHVYDYKRVKDGKEKIVEDDDAMVSDICRKILKKAKKDRIERQKMTEEGRQKYAEELDKKDLIKKLKKRNLYVKGMSKKEMIATLKVFL